MTKNIDLEFISEVESADFRTVHDTGANHNALYIWNKVRAHVGLERLTKAMLPNWCLIHKKYHVIQEDYGCRACNCEKSFHTTECLLSTK